MNYFLILFASPIYFALRSQWIAFTINAFLYGLAWMLLLTLFFAVGAPLFWALAVGHASWYLRNELMNEHAELIASKMANKLRGENAASLLAPNPQGPEDAGVPAKR